MKDVDTLLHSIDLLERDSLSGSTELLDRLLNALLEAEPSLNPDDKAAVSNRIDQFVIRKPHFQVIAHFASELNHSTGEWHLFLRQYKNQYGNLFEKISKQLFGVTGPSASFLLHSHSKTIVSVFENLAQHAASYPIFQTYAEPEGHLQAAELNQLGFRVTLVEDAIPNEIMKKIDFFVSGADAILPNSIINKSGTKAIAEKTIQHHKPYVVLCDSRKFCDQYAEKVRDPFERIPRYLITHLLTGH